MKLKEIIKEITTRLIKNYDEAEASAIARVYVEEKYNVTFTDITINKEVDISGIDEQDIQKLAVGKPVQQVLHSAYFMDMKFMVDENILIPRPETEELVMWILNEHQQPAMKVLDIGTGSGCIPISLKVNRPSWNIEAIEVNEKAMTMAKKNAAVQEANIRFFQQDILGSTSLPDVYDLIVSNPPYITHQEKPLMHKNVLEHEPHLALFVPDDQPLLFYEKIATLGCNHLADRGCLYFEINENFCGPVMQMLITKGYKDVQLRKDINNKDRMVKAVWAP